MLLLQFKLIAAMKRSSLLHIIYSRTKHQICPKIFKLASTFWNTEILENSLLGDYNLVNK